MDPTHSVNNVDEGMTYTRPLIPGVLFHPGSTKDPFPNWLDPTCLDIKRVHKVQVVKGTRILTQILTIDFEENSPFQESVILEAYHRPDKSFFQELWKLNDPINTSNLIRNFYPSKQI